MLRSKIFPLVLHLLGWVLFMCLPLVFMSQGKSFAHFAENTWGAYCLFVAVYLSSFYLNAYLIFPRLFIRKKYAGYVVAILFMFVAVLYIRPFDNLMKTNRAPHGEFNPKLGPPPGPNPAPMHFDITSIFVLFTMLGLGTALQAIRQRQLYENKALLAEKDRSSAELSFLKAQINPHFLYNTLNNIYTLSVIGSPDAPESIMKLSNIMRYVTDQSEADFVPLAQEIDCIGNFVALQQLRLGDKVTLNYRTEGKIEGQRIAPLVLMTFIENVFKYGLSNHYPSTVDILIKIKDREISLYTNNPVFEHKPPQQRKGVGLENTKKRLKHLYLKQHTLSIKNEGGFFTVFLVLKSK